MNPDVNTLTINFTDDVEIFAKAALTGLHAGSEIEELEQSQLDTHPEGAFLKNIQIGILGKIAKRNQNLAVYGDSSIQSLHYRVTTLFSARFLIEPIKTFQTPNPAQSVNRGDNLALEAIVYASKIPVFQKQAESKEEVEKLVEKVHQLQFDIRRFSASHRALVVCNLIDEFIAQNL
jgi:hypothetical protein